MLIKKLSQKTVSLKTEDLVIFVQVVLEDQGYFSNNESEAYCFFDIFLFIAFYV